MLSDIEIIDGFGKIMTGYLLFMDQSEILQKSRYIDTILYNGANIIIHVFSIYVCSNDTLENIVSECCDAYAYYLEYIEQLDKSNLSNNLHITDISTFVYKSTIGKIGKYSECASEEIRTPENSESLPNSSEFNHWTSGIKSHMDRHDAECMNADAHGHQEIRPVIKRLNSLYFATCTWNILLSWNSSFSLNARLAICDVYLTKYSKLFQQILEYPRYMDYLGIIQEKWKMDENVYFAFLNEYFNTLFKLQKSGKLLNNSYMTEKILLFCIQYHLEDTPTEDNIRSIVRRLL